MNTINQRMAEIRYDRISGASQLTRLALETLQRATSELTFNNPEDYQSALIEIAREMTGLRPSMHSIKYYMNRFIADIKNCPLSADLPTCSLNLSGKLIHQWEESSRQLILAGSSMVQNSANILTGSYSSSVIRCLIQARDDGKDYNLFIVRSKRSDNQPAYGVNMAEELTRRGITSTVINDIEIAGYMGMIDVVLLGADTVLADGAVINGYPSKAIALLAGAGGVPVYILCETSKFSDQLSADPEPGFEIISADLITAVISR